jgi:hypothetical protein
MSITEVTSEPAYSGHYRQVVLIQRGMSITEVTNEPAYSGHYRQVVLIQRGMSITEVTNEPAYSGHYRQVVFLYKWSLGHVSLYIVWHCLLFVCVFCAVESVLFSPRVSAYTMYSSAHAFTPETPSFELVAYMYMYLWALFICAPMSVCHKDNLCVTQMVDYSGLYTGGVRRVRTNPP